MPSPPIRSASKGRQPRAGRRWSNNWPNSESAHRRGIAPGDEFRHDKAVAPLAKTQVFAVRVRDLATSGGDDGMAGRDVPFAGWGEAGINIGSALCDAAEFDRRAKRLPDRTRPCLNKGLSPCISMGAADGRDPGRAAAREGAGMDRLDISHRSLRYRQSLGAAAHQPAPYQSEGRGADDAQ